MEKIFFHGNIFFPWKPPGPLPRRNAFLAGADGVICSPLEANLIRKKNQFSDKIIVTPGIRLDKSDAGDQKRVSTPSQAIRAGADYIVVGRPIWNAKDPILAVNEILKDM